MVLKHNQVSAGSDISKRNPKPDREKASRIRSGKCREARIERAKARKKSDNKPGLRQQVKSGEITPSEALRKLCDVNPSPDFVAWVSSRKPVKIKKQKRKKKNKAL
jgi:hypothetical protein